MSIFSNDVYINPAGTWIVLFIFYTRGKEDQEVKATCPKSHR